MSGELRLVRAYLGGDAAAFEALYARHRGALEVFACYLKGNRTDAEDLCQSTWLAAIRSLASYQGRSSFRAWLHGIALNLHHDQLRQPRLAAVPLESELSRDDPEGDPQRAVERADTVRAVREALARLDPRQREVVVLSKILGFRYHETAAALGCPIGTVKSRLHYAVAALRADLAASPEVSHEMRRRTTEPERGG
jgi:RNA polymerase sigma factor (sigma-70 family)